MAAAVAATTATMEHAPEPATGAKTLGKGSGIGCGRGCKKSPARGRDQVEIVRDSEVDPLQADDVKGIDIELEAGEVNDGMTLL